LIDPVLINPVLINPVRKETSMSATIDLHSAKRILMIAADPAISAVTGWPVGFWWAELTHPYWAFVEVGYTVDIASPQGGDLQGDGYSDPEDASGYAADDLISLGFKHSPAHAERLKGTKAISDVNPEDYDAIFIAGGQSPMVTMIDDTALHTFAARAYEAGRILAVVCHGTCILLKTRLSSGDLLVKGRTWTGFANSEERYAESWANTKIQPFWIETEARKLEGTNFITDSAFKAFAVRDGNLITGQQQFSGAAAAQLVIQTLGQ
jgi:putative intracellular protease/amidase